MTSIKIFYAVTLTALLVPCWHAKAEACSIFMAADGKNVLVGNNEDDPPSGPFLNPKITFQVAGAERKYGNMIFSFDDGYPEGGMNTAGLFFDITQLPPVPDAQYDAAIKDFPGLPGALLAHIMDGCGSVKEALDLVAGYRLPGIEAAQIFFADKRGDAAVVGVGKDGKIAVTRKTGQFLLATNFSLANPSSGNYPEPRYTLASSYWAKHPVVSVRNFRTILAAIHFEGSPATIYSNLYDLKHGDMYLYFFHNYADAVKINLQEQLDKKVTQTISVSSLFPVIPFSVDYTSRLAGKIDDLTKNQCPKK
jgi:hypothetical protein